MKMLRRYVVVAAVLAVLTAQARAVGSDAKDETVYQKTLHATALVVSARGQGTAWVISRASRYLITSEHVVVQDSEVLVIFPAYIGGRPVVQRDYYAREGRPIRGRVVRTDVRRDLALVQVEALPDEADELKVASEAPSPGDVVHAVGCPSGAAGLWVYSHGMVRQVADLVWRDDSQKERSARVVATQLPLNPGDSGSPLVNDKGELVGVNHGRQPNVVLMSLSIDASEVKSFLTAARDEPNPAAEEHFRQADEAKAAKDWTRARDCLVRGLLLDPANLKRLGQLAWTFNELQDYDSALVASEAIIRRDNCNAEAWCEAGYAFLKKEEFEMSAKALLFAIKFKPSDTSQRKYFAEAIDGLKRQDKKELADHLLQLLKELDAPTTDL